MVNIPYVASIGINLMQLQSIALMVIDSNWHYFRLKYIATDFDRFFFFLVSIDTNLFYLLQLITGNFFNISSIPNDYSVFLAQRIAENKSVKSMSVSACPWMRARAKGVEVSESKWEGMQPRARETERNREQPRAHETERNREQLRARETESKREQTKLRANETEWKRSGPDETKVDCQNIYAGRTQLINQWGISITKTVPWLFFLSLRAFLWCLKIIIELFVIHRTGILTSTIAACFHSWDGYK